MFVLLSVGLCVNIAHTSTTTGRSADRIQGGPHVRAGAASPDRRHPRPRRPRLGRRPRQRLRRHHRDHPPRPRHPRAARPPAPRARRRGRCRPDHPRRGLARRAPRPQRHPEGRDRPRGARPDPPDLPRFGAARRRQHDGPARRPAHDVGARRARREPRRLDELRAARRPHPQRGQPARHAAAPRRLGARHHRGGRRARHDRPAQRHPTRSRIRRRERGDRRLRPEHPRRGRGGGEVRHGARGAPGGRARRLHEARRRVAGAVRATSTRSTPLITDAAPSDELADALADADVQVVLA